MKRLTYDLHRQWMKEYLHLHHRIFKWHHPTTNLKVGDLVGIKEATLGHHCLPIGRVDRIYPGDNGLVRVVDVFDGTNTIQWAIQWLTLVMTSEQD